MSKGLSADSRAILARLAQGPTLLPVLAHTVNRDEQSTANLLNFLIRSGYVMVTDRRRAGVRWRNVYGLGSRVPRAAQIPRASRLPDGLQALLAAWGWPVCPPQHRRLRRLVQPLADVPARRWPDLKKAA